MALLVLPAATPGADIAGTIALPHRRSWFRWDLRRRARGAAADPIIRRLGVRCRAPQDTLDLLSGGNQQKVVIGRWQSAPCRLLLLDEPFQGVDVGARRDIVEAIRADRRDGATLIATSDVEEAIEAADVVAVMRDHSIVGAARPAAERRRVAIAAIAALETIEATIDEGERCCDRRLQPTSGFDAAPRLGSLSFRPRRCAAMRSSSSSLR